MDKVDTMSQPQAKYFVGQLVRHKLFGYRGVIADVDPQFAQSEEWYELLATTRPLKDQPWYQILVDETDLTTYVAEQNILADESGEPINHPDLKRYFSKLEAGHYLSKKMAN